MDLSFSTPRLSTARSHRSPSDTTRSLSPVSRTPLDLIPPVIPSLLKHSPSRRFSVSLRVLGNSSTLLGFRRHTALFWQSGTARLQLRQVLHILPHQTANPSGDIDLLSITIPAVHSVNSSTHVCALWSTAPTAVFRPLAAGSSSASLSSCIKALDIQARLYDATRT